MESPSLAPSHLTSQMLHTATEAMYAAMAQPMASTPPTKRPPPISPPPTTQTVYIPGYFGGAVSAPLLIIKIDLYDWIINNKQRKDGRIFLLGKNNKRSKIISSAILLMADGGCKDSNLITTQNIVHSLQLLKEINVFPAGLCTCRHEIPGENCRFMNNCKLFCTDWEDLGFVCFTTYCQIVWMKHDNKIYRSLLGVKK